MGRYEEYTYFGVKWRVFVVYSLEEGIAAIQRGEEAVKIYNSDGKKKIKDDGAKKVAAELKNNRTLKLLVLGYNEIGDAGAGSLAEASKVNSTLTMLNLEDNKIGPEGAGSLAEALKANSTLTTLDLEDNKIGPEGAGSLGEGLKANSTLTTLVLVGNKIGYAGAGSLAEALKVNSSLTFLNVSENNLNLESQTYLAACASFQIQSGVDYEDARVRAAQAHGIQARQNGLSPSRVPHEVLARDTEESAIYTKTYLEGLLFSEDSVHQLKVLVVGPQKVGKTSLRRALKKKGLEADPTQEDDADRATISVDIDEVEFEALSENDKGGKISLWDFGGQEEYYMTHAFFLSNRSLVMVVVDLQAYEDNDQAFEDCAGKWLRALQMQIFRPKVLLVGTKCDTQTTGQIEAKIKSLERRVDELGLKVREAIMEKAKGLSKEEQEVQRLVSFEGLTFTEPRSFAVSGVDVSKGAGVANLYKFLKELASNTDKSVALRVPKAFEDLRSLIELKRDGEGQRIQSLKELQRGASSRNLIEREHSDMKPIAPSDERVNKGKIAWFPLSKIFRKLKKVLNFGKNKALQREAGLEEEDMTFRLALGLLHDLGIILWYEMSEQLSDVVFSDPAWVVEIVRQVFRHDLFERCEGDKKEGALYNLESNGTVDLPALQKLLRDKCILDERLLRLFPMWKKMNDGMFERCVDLLQQFDLMYKISKTDKHQNESKQYMVPLFLRSGFRKESLEPNECDSNRYSHLLSRKQTYDFFVFIPDGFLFRVIARTFRLAEFTKLSEHKAKAEYKTESGVCIDVELTSQVNFDGSGVFSISFSCLSTSERALEILKRTQELFTYEVNQLLEESFRLVPFKVTEISIAPEQLRGKKKNSTPRLNESPYICQNANDFSYFGEETVKNLVRRALERQNKYMVKKHCLDAICQQLDKKEKDQTAAHLVHVGKDVRGKLKRNFRLSLETLHTNDPLRERFFEFQAENPDESDLDDQKAEEFLKLVRQFLSRLRTEFDCFLAHKWGEGGLNHAAVVQLKERLEKKGLKCWVDSSEMKSNLKEMLKGIDKSQVFVACITEDYLDAVEQDDSYCEMEYSHAMYKSSCDLVPMFMDQKVAHEDFLQSLPRMAWKLHCSSDTALFDRVLQQLFPHDKDATLLALLEMYPAAPSS